MRSIDITNQRFGRLVAIKRSGFSNRHAAIWECQCDCGNIVHVLSASLRCGDTKSCGCLKRDCGSQMIKSITGEGSTHFKHGDAKAHNMARLYYVWLAMKDRCRNPNNKRYKDYGGRGITVCEEWLRDYTAFRNWAMANGYDPTAPRGACTIDRIDVDGNYCPENCRWVSMKVQNRNKRSIEK